MGLSWKRAPLALLAALTLACAASAGAVSPPKATDRIVCLGDSITDGCTYPQIIMQALREAGRPVPSVVCAGVASDTAPQMAARLEATVLRFRPTLVTFSAGTNDSLRGLTPAVYEKALRQVIARVKARGAAMVLLTPCIISPRKGATDADKAKAAAAETLAAAYARVIRTVAAEMGFAVAETNALMRAARSAGENLMSDDGIHPNYRGQSLMARSILDAMGCSAAPLPKQFQPRLFPGVVPAWRMRLAPLDADGKPQRLTDEAAHALRPDGSWKTYTLPDPEPESKPSAEDWWEQERRNGFGLKLHERVGKGRVQAVAVIQAKEASAAFVNTGIGVSALWLNGRKIHEQGKAWTGFHAGKERIAVKLRAGANRLAAELEGQHFFLSVTDKLVWEGEPVTGVAAPKP